MFETDDLNPIRPEDRTITLYLNRDCPRKCYQCGIADGSKRPMSAEDWLKAVDHLHKIFGATFFLCLGVEPLLLKDAFIDLVQGFTKRGLEAAWYTTSPEPMFTRWREDLIAAGIRNWSSGVDTLPHLPALDPETDKKSKEAIIGLKWMAARGIPVHITTTIHKKNLHLIPEIGEWLYSEIPTVEWAVNFIHWRKGGPFFDFMSPPEDMADMLWDGSAEERMKVQEIMAQVLAVTKKPGRKMHTYDAYMTQAHRFYDKIDLHCQGAIGPSVDADGTMRLCGYHTGWEVKAFDVRELDVTQYRFQAAWERDLAECSGCYWACYRLPEKQMRNHVHPDNIPPSRHKLLQIRKNALDKR